MNSLEAFILGIIQGLTEFLPVSSSGHLELAKVLFGSNALPKESLLFTVLLHLATALSTVVLYRKDIASIVRRLWSKDKEAATFSAAIVVSMIPAAAVGFFFEDFIDSLFSGNFLLVGALLMVTALLLYIADTYPAASKELTLKKAFIVGLSQAVAILPGVSRSGATISTAVVLGIDRTQAARFFFFDGGAANFRQDCQGPTGWRPDEYQHRATSLAVGILRRIYSWSNRLQLDDRLS